MSARISVALAVGVLAFGFGSATTQAEPVTFNFTGTVNYFESAEFSLASPISAGDQFSGSYTFETSQYPQEGDYVLSDFSMTIGANVFSLDPAVAAAQILVTNGEAGVGTDEYEILGGMTFDAQSLLFDIWMCDVNGSVFSDNSLPAEPPDFSLFEFSPLTIEYGGAGESSFYMDAWVDSLTTVPSPTSALLGLIGLAAVWSLRRQFGW